MFQINYKGKEIVVISDTHGYHNDLIIPKVDIIIHCGDICTDGNLSQIKDFLHWYGALDIPNKLLLSGNHDFTYPLISEIEWSEFFGNIPKGIISMDGNKIISIDGITIGALEQGFLFQTSFESFTERIDILVSHEPPFGVLDNGFGCPDLLDYVMSKRPKYHFFGHIHEGAGRLTKDDTTFVNVCDYDVQR